MKKAFSFILLLSGLFASAQFSGAYNEKNWTLSPGGRVDNSDMPNSITLKPSKTRNYDSRRNKYYITVPTTTEITFDWHVTNTYDVENLEPIVLFPSSSHWGDLSGFDYSYTGANEQSGTMTVTVQAGSTLGFMIFDNSSVIEDEFYRYDGVSFTISNFRVADRSNMPTTQTFCVSGTVADLVAATGNNLNWYAAQTGGTALSTSTALVTGTYYVSETLNSVESIRTPVAVTINNPRKPVIAPNINFSFSSDYYACGQPFYNGTYINSGLKNGRYEFIYDVGNGEIMGISYDGTQWRWGWYNEGNIEYGFSSSNTSNGLYPPSSGWTDGSCTPYITWSFTDPPLACYQTTTFNSTTCAWDITGTPPALPTAADQTFCVSGTVADLVATGTAIQWYAAASITESGSALASGTALVNGTTYYASQTLNSCESDRTAVVIEVGTTTTWNGTNWNNGAPISNSKAVISGNYSEASNLAACSLEVIGTAIVTVPSGYNFSVSGSVTVASSASLTFENNANLIQVDAVGNTGNIIVKRNSAPIVRLDHTLWSSPVAGQNLFAFSPATLTNRFYSYNTSSNKYVNTGLDANSTFEIGKGFAIRAPNNQTALTPTVWQGTFTGVPNNGTIPFTLDATTPGYNLVGNPYPSTIDAAAFIAENSNIAGTLYFYAHSLSMDANGTFPAGNKYSTWNATGHTLATHIGGDVHLTPEAPNGIIQVGQGFLVKATAAGTINFTNAMRVANNVNQSFRPTAIEKDRLWLNLKTAAGVDINQILVGYITDATQGVDRNYDGLAFGNTGSFLSSKIEGADYTIQGRSLPFDTSDTVPLGFKAATAGDFAIALTKSDGLFASNQEVFLKDNLTGTTHNIKVSPYTFSSQLGTFDTRFSLVYTPSLAVPTNSFTPNSVVVYKADEWFTIKTNGIIMKDVSVYDMAGRLIYQQSGINADSTILKGLSQANGVRLVKIVSQENETVTVKIIN